MLVMELLVILGDFVLRKDVVLQPFRVPEAGVELPVTVRVGGSRGGQRAAT